MSESPGTQPPPSESSLRPPPPGTTTTAAAAAAAAAAAIIMAAAAAAVYSLKSLRAIRGSPAAAAEPRSESESAGSLWHRDRAGLRVGPGLQGAGAGTAPRKAKTRRGQPGLAESSRHGPQAAGWPAGQRQCDRPPSEGDNLNSTGSTVLGDGTLSHSESRVAAAPGWGRPTAQLERPSRSWPRDPDSEPGHPTGVFAASPAPPARASNSPDQTSLPWFIQAGLQVTLGRPATESRKVPLRPA